MSIYINGFLAPSAAYSGSPLSASFAARLPPVANSQFVVTVNTGSHGLRSMLLTCHDVSSNESHSVVLGEDWAGYLRYSLARVSLLNPLNVRHIARPSIVRLYPWSRLLSVWGSNSLETSKRRFRQIHSDGSTAFEPVLVDSVRSISQQGAGFGAHVELEFPIPPSIQFSRGVPTGSTPHTHDEAPSSRDLLVYHNNQVPPFSVGDVLFSSASLRTLLSNNGGYYDAPSLCDHLADHFPSHQDPPISTLTDTVKVYFQLLFFDILSMPYYLLLLDWWTLGILTWEERTLPAHQHAYPAGGQIPQHKQRSPQNERLT
ncbi:hypothetical protein B0H11DRAFT_1942949 [Mycena galericulata]|nr:hypothetical protein B0H11DRAFT_1942949 [Mycena galericulata]